MVQGVFGAMLQPSALAQLRASFPAEKLNGAVGVWGAVIGASTAAGPIVGGLLVLHVGWEYCFYVNIPVGVAALIMGLLVLRETPASKAATSFDVPGIAALSGALITPLSSVDPNMGLPWLVSAFMLVMVSGGSLPTLAVSCLVLGGLQVIVSTFVNPILGGLTIAICAAIVLRIRPEGFARA